VRGPQLGPHFIPPGRGVGALPPHAMEAWAARVLSIVEPLPDKVIRLK
jgi:hypothetical protein